MKNFLKSKLFTFYFLLFTFLIGASLRLYGLNWDQNHHLHPDERFLTMVTGTIKWPTALSEYLDSQRSPANPYNVGYNFFVYGTLPMYLVKAAAKFIKLDPYDYNNITLVGRVVSAIFDLGTLILVFFITKKLININPKYQIPLLATFLYAISVLPIQLSHFYAVDTFLVFFIALSFYLLLLLQYAIRNTQYAIYLGLAFGSALACKITALLFLPIIGLGFLFGFLRHKKLKLFTFYFLLFTFSSYFSLRLADPRVFATGNFLDPTINPQFISNLKELNSFNNPNTWFPPAVQWLKTKPIIFPLKNMVLWGLGLPLGTITLLAITFSIGQIGRIGLIGIKQRKFPPYTKYHILHTLIILWILFLFLYQGIQFAKGMRYFAPIYPFLAITTAFFFSLTFSWLKQKVKSPYILHTTYYILLISFLIWPVSFMAIYSQPHSRVMASEWIYQNIPAGLTISCEHWDDCLPLGIKGESAETYHYQTEMLAMYDQDTPEKWQKINQQLEKIDFLILSSNRLWGSIPKVPERYPITAKFYQDLFAGKLNFTKVAEITSYSKFEIRNSKFEIDDSSADESFTVYDHPQVIIFKKTERIRL